MMNRLSIEAIQPSIEVQIEREASSPGWISDCLALAKARLTTLVLITAFVGFCMASRGGLDWFRLFNTLLGTALVAAASQTLNQVIEVEADRQMDRTKDRPIPGGRINRTHALWGGVVLAVAGISYLLATVNIPTSCLATATLVLYLGLYTPMKRRTPFCIKVGAVAGAIPPALGWVAVRPSMDAGAWDLFAILFFWQIPHFLAIAWMYREQYTKAGFIMLRPEDRDGRVTAFESFAYSIGLGVVTLMPFFLHLASLLYLAVALILNAILLLFAARFLAARTRANARTLFFASVFYLPVLLAALVFSKN